MMITQFDVVSKHKKVLGNPNRTIESSDHFVVPVLSLNPYKSHWTVIARVTSKSLLRKWNNEKGEGQVFNMDLVDSTVREKNILVCSCTRVPCTKVHFCLMFQSQACLNECPPAVSNYHKWSIVKYPQGCGEICTAQRC